MIPGKVYMVMYNLVGLHPIITLKYDEENEWYADSTGNHIWEINVQGDCILEPGYHAQIFQNKSEAERTFNTISNYRDFIKAHL